MLLNIQRFLNLRIPGDRFAFTYIHFVRQNLERIANKHRLVLNLCARVVFIHFNRLIDPDIFIFRLMSVRQLKADLFYTKEIKVYLA